MVAQSLADHEGPRVDIHARFNVVGNSRHLRASFNVSDDAYVLIGHVDADGVVRVVFPTDPKDDGFVRAGNRAYETSEFFAGFEEQYRFRANTYGRFAGYNPEAYDASAGYLFIVASWRPMQFTKFSTEGVWDSFEVVDNTYKRGVEPAIYEFAALLAGENREAYTVKFARYYNTTSYGGYGLASSAFSSGGICNASFAGFYHGFGFQSWNLSFIRPMMSDGIFYYRGQQYAYDSFRDCAVPLGYNYGYGYGFGAYQPYPRISQGPPTTGPIGSRPRVIAAEDSPRNPIEPRNPPTPGKVAPVTAQGAGGIQTRHFTAEDRTRPSIQQMTERRVQEQNSFAWNRGQARSEPRQASGNNDGWTRARANDANGVDRSTRGMNQPRAHDAGTNGTYTPANRGAEQGYSRPAPVEASRSAPAAMPHASVPSTPTVSAPPASSTPASSSSASKPTP